MKTTCILVFCDNIVEQFRINLGVVPFLREVNSIHLACFDLLRDVVRVDLMTSVSCEGNARR